MSLLSSILGIPDANRKEGSRREASAIKTSEPVVQSTPATLVTGLISPSRPTSTTITQPRHVPQTWSDIADKVGFCPGELLDMQIQAYLYEQQVPIYSLDKVRTYMTNLAKARAQIFVWRPLRVKDRKIFEGWGWGTEGEHETYRNGTGLYSVYDRLVPAHALDMVSLLEAKFEGKVSFFVSDYKSPDPDPFLMVTAPSATVKKRVIAAWDEPGFGVT